MFASACSQTCVRAYRHACFRVCIRACTRACVCVWGGGGGGGVREREYVFTEGLYSALEALNKKGNYA